MIQHAFNTIPGEKQWQQADWSHWIQPFATRLKSLTHSLDCWYFQTGCL